MTDFLLELRCEEIPARMQAGARAELDKLFHRELAAAGLAPGAITIWSTPRRLALIARDLPQATEAVSDEAKGPPEGAPDAALDGFCRKNNVTRDQLELRDVKGRNTWFAVIEKPGRATRAVLAQAIPAIIRDFAWPKSMRWGAPSISTESPRWVRPLSGIVAIFGEELVECAAGGITSGYATMGHRFHSPRAITIGGADDYQEKLRACHVIVDHEERAATIREGAARAAEEAGLALVADEGLVIENAGLTEWPVPLLGRFDETFLDVPPEVTQLTARVNQKYFVCSAPDGTLANAFVCTANIAAEDGGAGIVDGNRKVLAARLSDARFFWEQDRKVSLADHAEKLARITFHEKLGTVADKVERVAKLARWLVEQGIVRETPLPLAGGAGGGPVSSDADIPSPNPSRKREGDLADLAEQAARLCKADLVTGMVGEFPELQGLMGGYYARAEGLPDAVADAIRDHYKPVGQGDDVPTAPVTVAVSLADKLDTLVGFFSIDERPTGSKDPFALRRAALSIIRLIQVNDIKLELTDLFAEASASYMADEILDTLKSRREGAEAAMRQLYREQIDVLSLGKVWDGPLKGHVEEQLLAFYKSAGLLLAFFADRLKVQQREAGVRHDLIDAVFSLGGEDDLVRLLARVKALQNYVETAEGANLLAAYKRAANILKKEDWPNSSEGIGTEGEIAQTGEEDPLANVDDPELASVIAAKMDQRKSAGLSYTPEAAEKALIDALESASPRADAAIAAEDFTAAMAALASLRAPIDAFFEEVTVNDPDPAKRNARLGLLAKFRAAVHKVADFGEIQG